MKSSDQARSLSDSGSPASPVVFVFFDAWTLVTGRHIGMVRRILERGFDLLDFEFKTLSEADAEEIYRTNHPIREGNSWHVARLVYPMGRSLGLLFGLRDPGSCACERMQRLKGKANPSLNTAGQLRHDFLAPNRCLSLMHSSDGLAQVMREGLVFFTAARLETACRVAAEGTNQTGALLNELIGSGAESGIERVGEPGLGALFARVRLRLVRELQRFWVDASRTSALAWNQAPVLEYQALWEPVSKETSRAPVMSEARAYLQGVAHERPLLEALIGSQQAALRGSPGERARAVYCEYYRPPAHEPQAILRCLQVLNNPEAYSRWDSQAQLPRTVLYDRWEWLLLRTHLFNFDDLLPAAGRSP